MSKVLKKFVTFFTKKSSSHESSGEAFIFDSNLTALPMKFKPATQLNSINSIDNFNRTNNSNNNNNNINNINNENNSNNIDDPKFEKFIAVCDYKRQASEDIDISINDNLLLLHKTYPDFYHVKNLNTGKRGFVPLNSIKPVTLLQVIKEIAHTNRDWFFKDISRRDSERLLEYFENDRGVFLVRTSSQENGRFSLSILDISKEKQRHTKHYLIERNEHLEYFIKRSRTFKTIDDLIKYYSEFSDGICCKLLKPCPKETDSNDLKDIWEEKVENIELGEIIGKGNFGDVYKGVWRNKFEVAVKALNLDVSAAKDALDECETLKKLRHEKIIKLWCVCTKQNPILIVIEYMCNGSLLEYMRKGEGKDFKFNDIIDIAAQIASGMKYMEVINFVHKDLAARNILVGKNKLVKIGDFGLTEKLNENGKFYMDTEGCLFPIKWTAPEIYKTDKNGKRCYTIKSDVWAYGILLFELVTLGDDPYKGLTNKQVMHKIEFEDYRMPKPVVGLCTEPYYQKMLKCWNSDPMQRDTFESLYHFFNDYFINIEPGYRFSSEI